METQTDNRSRTVPLNTYACRYKNDEIRMHSSSGGVFYSLAVSVLAQHGVVYGVAMSEDCYSAEFIPVTDIEGLKKLRGSKYLQAKVGDAYKQAKQDLLDGRMVLFTGTGCQINGLKCFLGKDYENLVCVDVICHGTPSPALWQKYARYQEEKYGGKLSAVNFRCKDNGWKDFGMKETVDAKQVYISKGKDPYMQMFLSDYCLRPSCYACAAKQVKLSDITIGDFWGIERIAPKMNDLKGTSLVLVRTVKGQALFDAIKKDLTWKEVSYEDGVSGNSPEYRSVGRPRQRDTFFEDMNRMDFERLSKKYMTEPLEKRIKQHVRHIARIIRFKIRGGVKRTNSNADYGVLFTFSRNARKDSE